MWKLDRRGDGNVIGTVAAPLEGLARMIGSHDSSAEIFAIEAVKEKLSLNSGGA